MDKVLVWRWRHVLRPRKWNVGLGNVTVLRHGNPPCTILSNHLHYSFTRICYISSNGLCCYDWRRLPCLIIKLVVNSGVYNTIMSSMGVPVRLWAIYFYKFRCFSFDVFIKTYRGFSRNLELSHSINLEVEGTNRWSREYIY